jgi:endonuclease YncB( thermonuclease family)
MALLSTVHMTDKIPHRSEFSPAARRFYLSMPLIVLILIAGASCTRRAPSQPIIKRQEKLTKSESPATTNRVIGVHDGDTITVIDEKNAEHKIRLAAIDAPEIGMPSSKASKEYLSKLVFGKYVEMRGDKTDRYGRWVRTIYVDNLDVNLEQIKNGLAWHYKKYEKEQTSLGRSAYSDAELDARKKNIGIWSENDPMPPWARRHR